MDRIPRSSPYVSLPQQGTQPVRAVKLSVYDFCVGHDRMFAFGQLAQEHLEHMVADAVRRLRDARGYPPEARYQASVCAIEIPVLNLPAARQAAREKQAAAHAADAG